MNKFLWAVVAVLVVGLGWWTLSNRGTSAPATETGPIKIGASIPLTGDVASIGEQIKAGIDTAVKEVNGAGGVAGRQIEVVYEDDKCSKDGATTFSKLVNIDHVTAIVGPLCSPAASPATPIAQQGHTPTIIWASAPGLTLAGDYIFRTYPSDSAQGGFAAKYVYDTLGKRRVAILYTKNPWGEGLRDVFTKRFTELGGAITDTEGADDASNDVRTQLTKIKASKPELLYMPAFPANSVAAVKQTKQLDITIPIMGGDALEAKDFLSVPEAEGVLISESKFSQTTDDFKARVKTATGADVGNFTALGYDAIKVLAQIMSAVGTNQQALRDAMVKVDYKSGVSVPEISFDQNRELKMPQYGIKVVHNGKTETAQ